MEEGFLKRYTDLPFLLSMLRSKQLTLVSPATWDDRNDAYYMLKYQEGRKCGSVLALCFSTASETYHHWRVFSSGRSGVCIDFNMLAFRDWVKAKPELQFFDVEYHKLSEVRGFGLELDELPFVKRWAFRDECEMRLVFEEPSENARFHNVKIDISMIQRIVLSPWLPKPVANDVKESIRAIEGCSDLDIFRTTLLENEEWKKHGDEV